MQNPKLAAALDHARRGFAVFPLIPEGKTPALENWQNLATNDPAQLEAWWRRWPNANIGVQTNRLLVVDIDPRNGGRETFETLQLVEDFPDTAVSQTQSGGVHFIYKLPPHVSTAGGRNRLGAGVDVKSRGGLIVAPGSSIEGRPYKWIYDRPPTEAPQWLIDRCNVPSRKTRAAGKRIIDEDETALEMAENYLATFAPEATEGGRDNTAFAVAARLYDFGVSKETCQALLLEWNEVNCHPPLDLESIERVATSALHNRDNAIGSRHPNAPGFEVYEMSAAKAVKAATQNGVKPARKGLYRVSYAEAATRALAASGSPLIKGLLDREAMSVIYGESNSGKTFTALDLVFHVTTGRPWAGLRVRRGAAVYVAAEGGRGIFKRFAALKCHHGVDSAPLDVVPCPVDLLRPEADLRPLLALIAETEAQHGKVEMVVIDTLSRVIAGGDENGPTDMGALVKHFDIIRTAAKTHLAVIHHSGKNKAAGARGHSLLRAATDTEIEVADRTIAVTKQRDLDGDRSWGFRLVPVRLGVDEDGDPVTSCVVEIKNPGEPAEQLPMTPAEQELIGLIDLQLEVEGKLPDTPFDLKFVAKSVTEGNCALSVRGRAIYNHLHRLAQKGHIGKNQQNQWFRIGAQ